MRDAISSGEKYRLHSVREGRGGEGRKTELQKEEVSSHNHHRHCHIFTTTTVQLQCGQSIERKITSVNNFPVRWPQLHFLRHLTRRN